MEVTTYTIPADVLTLFMEPDIFPQGIDDTFKKLGALIGGFEGREVYGTAEMTDGRMIYRACVKEQYPGEGVKYNLPYYTIPKGKYLCTTLKDWRNHLPEINKVFQQLAQHSDARKNSPVLEYYKNEDEALLMLEHN